jgi:ATP/maltotriose-dependent transcriptional regulator MalT
MATATPASASAISIANAEALITSLNSKLATVVGTLNAHIAAQEAAIAAHTAEVSAAKALIQKASPGTTAAADNAAAIILTASPQVQGVVGWLGKNWRYVVGAVCVGIIAYAKMGLHLL